MQRNAVAGRRYPLGVATNTGRSRGSPAVVVIGAGVTGAFCSYFLALLGATVYLVERGAVGGQASGHNAGGINALHGPGIPSPLLDLALASVRLHTETWAATRDLPGAALSGRAVERVHLIMDEDDAARAGEAAALHDATPGFSSRWMTQAELRTQIRSVTTEAIGGLWTSGNLWIDPERYTGSVTSAAQHRGVELVAAEALGVRCKERRVTAVVLDDGEMACDAVVVAPGPWTGQLERWFGLRLAVSPLKGELLLVSAATGLPAVELTWRQFGLHTAPDGLAWAGGTEEWSGFDASPSDAARDSIRAGIEGLLPGLAPLHVVRHVAALRPLSADGLPIVGLLDDFENVCIAGGAGRKGMLFGPALGKAAADLVTSGSTSLPISSCRLDRPGMTS
jgi:glycine/D-amino acid oxidase-like deaminating enzyme